jgi:hypothetical protein
LHFSQKLKFGRVREGFGIIRYFLSLMFLFLWQRLL